MWGSNACNQLGILSNEQCYSIPTKLTLLSSPQASPLLIAAGGSHALCLTDEGELYSWGDGEKGQLGLGSAITECSTPHLVFFRTFDIHSRYHSFIKYLL